MTELLLQWSTEGWTSLWRYVVLAALAAFVIMGLVVGVGAIRDLLLMFRDLRAGADESPDS